MPNQKNESLARILRLHEAKKKSGFAPRESDDPQGTTDRDQETTDPDKNQQPPQFGGDAKPAEKDGDKKDKTGDGKPKDAKTINKKEMRQDITLTSKDKDEMDKVPAGGKTVSGEKANKIQVTPIIEGSTVVYTFGRMNPPTIGHQKLVEAMLVAAKDLEADTAVFLSRSVDESRNPIPYQKKMGYAIKAFGSVVKAFPESVQNDVFGISKYLSERYEHGVLVVGSDRVQELQEKMLRHVGSEYLPFKSLHIVSAGDRDASSCEADGAAASALRESARAGDVKAFTAGLPNRLKSVASLLYHDVRIEEQVAQVPSLNESNIGDIIDVAEARREEPYELSFKEQRSIREKAEAHQMPASILEQVYRRGVANWIQEDVSHLTHQQFAFNRINSFLAGGAALELDQDLAEQALLALAEGAEEDLKVLSPKAKEQKPEHGVIITPTPSSKFDGSIRLKDPQSKVDKDDPKKSRPGKMSVQTLMRQVYEGHQLVNEVWDRNDPHSSGYHHGYYDKHMSEMDLHAKFPKQEHQQAWAEARRLGTSDRVVGKPAKPK